MLKSFLKIKTFYFQVGTNVEAYLRDRELRGQARTQPYLLCLGTTGAPSQIFVIVDKEALPCENEDITVAVDRLFKLHYVFNLEYASELRSFYSFLECFVYDIAMKNTKIPVRASELMTSIKVLSK